MLETIDFSFGGKTYKVGEAGVVFAYEIGTEKGRPYVVALTEKCGTVIFYIPEGIMEKLERRARMFPCPFSEYLSFLVEFRDFERLAVPFMEAGIMPKEAAARIGAALMPIPDVRRMGKVPVNRKAKTNNWLKMHGYPMRRKGKGKKRHE